MTHLTVRTIGLSICMLVVAMCCASELSAQEQPSRKLIIGTRNVAPFAIKNDDGTWEGLSIEMWENVADKMNVEYEYREFPLAELLTRVQSGELDAVVAALSVTSDRETKMDFSHPFLTSGLGVATRKNDRNVLGSIWKIVVWPLIFVSATIAVLLVVAGFIIWIVERKRNPEHFGGGSRAGLGRGIWWAAVTMTTVGYGDLAPRTVLGRSVAVLWMLIGIVIVSLFTAFVTSTLTAVQLSPAIKSTADLSKVKVSAVRDTSGSEYLMRNGIQHRIFDEPEDALDALSDGLTDAVVYDRPTLRHLAIEEYPGVTVVPATFEEEMYAIGFPSGSELRESVNQQLLIYLYSDSWKKTKLRYLGQ